MSKQPNYVFDDELYHWGIPGQRWGHRRFQNEDGSLTPEGREHYGYGDERSKAKISYNTQKYKADLKSRAKKEKATRSAKEERHGIKENAKTMRLARKEQGKFDRLNKKENAKLDRQGRPGGHGFGKTKNMSDDELQRAIDRLKLQAEYNKQYALASNPNGALARADRFFEGPTGKFVADLAVKTLPDITKSVVSKAFENKDNKLDIEKKTADIALTKAQARNFNSQAAERELKTNVAYQEKHLKDVKERAEKMFGGNKNDVKESSTKPSGTGIKGQQWEVKKSTASQDSNASKIRSSDDINRDFYNRLTNSGNKAADKLYTAAVNTVKSHTGTLMTEAEKGVKAGVNEALNDLLGKNSNNIAGYLPASVKKKNKGR